MTTKLTGRQAAEIQKSLAQFTEDCKTLEAQQAALVAKYSFQWAGVFKGTVHVAATPEELLRALGNDARHAAILYLDPDPSPIYMLCRS